MSKLQLASIFCPLMIIATHTFADELTIEGVDISRDVACSSHDIGIYGADHDIRLTGKCGRIQIHGSKHQVTFESATSISVSGADNRVTGGETQSLTVETAKNHVKAILKAVEGNSTLDVSGVENDVEIELKSPTKIDVRGSKQKVLWKSADGTSKPETSISGFDNDVIEKTAK